MAKTWRQKFDDAPHPHVDILDKRFAGLPPGARLLIASPKLIDDAVRRIPKGETRTIPDLRSDLARRYQADGTCPLTTSIFLRIAAEVALDSFRNGNELADILPFWRVVGPGDKIAQKLSCGRDFIAAMRKSEGIAA